MVADYCFENLIEAAEKAKKDAATKIITKSPKSKVTRDVWIFLSDGEKKKRMIALLLQTIKGEKND